jgi:EAL domain-containing protein (putative c-di-GMP-specific phosphodiesterase class I)/CheY-like chemotaxis protein
MTSRILLLDSDAASQQHVQRQLQRAGFEASVACDAENALRQAQEDRFDVALVSSEAPNRPFEVLHELRRVQPGCLRVLISDNRDGDHAVDALNRGEVVSVVSRGAPTTELIRGIEEAFSAQRRMSAAALSQVRATHEIEGRMLDTVLRERRIRLAVQAIVDVRTGASVAFEALMRPQHPVLDNPLAVLRVAEAHDRIGDVGASVFAEAATWLPRIPKTSRLFVNVHPEHFSNLERLQRDLAPLMEGASRVALEITERSRLIDVDRFDEVLAWVCDAGFSLAIDDLGSGYNNLAMLAEVQPHFIKVDMSLVRKVDVEPRKRRLVSLIASFAESTGSSVIAEGVETIAEVEALRGCGIHIMQGYHFSRPSLDPPQLRVEVANVPELVR